jgi:cytochrome c-type biogenesis protein CcmH/NrfF
VSAARIAPRRLPAALSRAALACAALACVALAVALGPPSAQAAGIAPAAPPAPAAPAAHATPAAAAPAAATKPAHVKPRTTLPIIERQVMCVTCKIPLQVAESPQANLEREYIQGLIAKGEDETEVKRTLVVQYGPAVLGMPAAHGFNLVAYLVPLAVVLALIATLVVLLPRWRRYARAQAAAPASVGPRLSPEESARLESDIARFD